MKMTRPFVKWAGGKWYHTDSDYHLKIRKPGETIRFAEMGTDKEVQDYVKNIRNEIDKKGKFLDSMVKYEEYRKEKNLSIIDMYRSFLRLRY